MQITFEKLLLYNVLFNNMLTLFIKILKNIKHNLK